jgi:probable phosphoglycerate mutase
VSEIVASPLSRAVATARVIADQLGVTRIGIDRRLIEIAYGAWEGLSQSDIRALWPDQLRTWKREPVAMLFPNGESLAHLRARVRDFIRDAARLQRRSEGSLLAVTHAGPIRIVTLEARERPLTQFRQIEVEPASISRFLLLRQSGVPCGVPRIQEV